MSLNYPISQIPTSIESKCAIFNTLFNFSAPLGAVNAYMNYYTQQCDLVSQRNRELYSRLEHYDMCDIAGRLIDGMPIQIAHSDWSNSRLGQHAQAAVFLVCQLLTMVDVPYAQLLLLENYEHVKTLEQFLGKIFPRSAAMVDVRKRIKPGLIARNISESAKIQINWTENLADHLKLESGGKTLHIFHRVSFLESQAKINHYWPKGFISETLETFSLLFPSSDDGTDTWFEEQRLAFQDAALDSRVLDHGTVRREDMFFGMVQSIEGAIQVYKAYHPAGPK